MTIPLVGTPFKITAWLPIVVGECLQCDQHVTILLSGELVARCVICGAAYQLVSFDIGGQKIPPGTLGIVVLATPPTTRQTKGGTS